MEAEAVFVITADAWSSQFELQVLHLAVERHAAGRFNRVQAEAETQLVDFNVEIIGFRALVFRVDKRLIADPEGAGQPKATPIVFAASGFEIGADIVSIDVLERI